MNAGVGLAVLSLIQLVLPLLLDRRLTTSDPAWFIAAMQARDGDGLGPRPPEPATEEGAPRAGSAGAKRPPRGGIAELFTEENDGVGRSRTNVVMTTSGLLSSARAVSAALAVSGVGAGVTLGLVIGSPRSPTYERARVVGLLVWLVAAVVALCVLRVKVNRHAIVVTSFGSSTIRQRRNVFTRSWGLFWFGITAGQLLTRYIAIALVANVVTIVAALGLS